MRESLIHFMVNIFRLKITITHKYCQNEEAALFNLFSFRLSNTPALRFESLKPRQRLNCDLSLMTAISSTISTPAPGPPLPLQLVLILLIASARRYSKA